MLSTISASRKNRSLFSIKWVKLTPKISHFFGPGTWTNYLWRAFVISISRIHQAVVFASFHFFLLHLIVSRLGNLICNSSKDHLIGDLVI